MKEENLRQLLSQMSIREKIGQLLQVSGFLFDEEALVTGMLDYFKIDPADQKLAGSILSISGAEKLKKIQDFCMEQQPHHIPQIFMLDIINGYETIYPVPLGQGATFDPEIAEELAHMAAKEGAAAGLHVTFSPMVDLVRDARWGRVMESTGEDSYLNGLMGAAMVRGYQGEDVASKGRLAACVKHFAGYGGAEGGRDYDNVELSLRTLKEEYLPAYEEAIKAGARLVMTSFNTLDRVPSSANQWLLRDVLREEMGFDGVVISDYGAVKEMLNHGMAKDETGLAKIALEAGVDIEMMSLCYMQGLEQLIADGQVSESFLNESVWRVLLLKNELGLFENPYKDADAADEKKLCLCEEHRELAREAAVRSFVLLQNEEECLPFDKNSKETIAFIGPYAESKQVYGSWSFPKETEKIVSIREGVSNSAPAGTIVFCQGSHMFGENTRLKDGSTYPYDRSRAEEMLKEALDAAQNADKVVMCIGEHFQQTGEAASRTVLQIPAEQIELLKKVHEVNENIVTLVFTGRPLELEEVSALSKSVMVVWFPGTECGNAVAQVLWGEKEPGGRLPMGFPYRATQMPCYYNRFRTGRPNSGTLDQPFVNGYIDQIDRMLYPFGYGLSYTRFEYGQITLSRNTLSIGEEIEASVTITNTGGREGTETVQMYLQDLYGTVSRPARQLRGFQKITLKPGESGKVSFRIREEMLRFWNIDMNYVSEPGTCRVYIGKDSGTTEFAEFEIIAGE